VHEPFPTHRLKEFSCLTADDVSRISRIAGPAVEHPRHAVIRAEGARDSSVYLLVDGWVLSSFVLRSGERQILKLHLPGDMLGSTSMCVDAAVDSLTALTPVTVRRLPLEALGALMVGSPRIATALLLSAQKERIALMDRLAAVARSPALSRIAMFLLDLNDRLALIGQSRENSFRLRITQEQLGDLLGLTFVHVNRMMRQLDRDGLIVRQASNVHLPDLDRLRAVATVPVRRMSAQPAWLPPMSDTNDTAAA
jgi:CRP/FNR family transcriptional regulator, anaerobic regulatory protein